VVPLQKGRTGRIGTSGNIYNREGNRVKMGGPKKGESGVNTENWWRAGKKEKKDFQA